MSKKISNEINNCNNVFENHSICINEIDDFLRKLPIADR